MSNTTIVIIIASVVLIILVITTVLAIPMISLRREKKKAEVLISTGNKGEATVLQLDDTGTRVNGNPRINILLEVRIPGYSPYQVQKTVNVPLVRLSHLQVGSVVAVLADPNQPANPDKVGILLR